MPVAWLKVLPSGSRRPARARTERGLTDRATVARGHMAVRMDKPGIRWKFGSRLVPVACNDATLTLRGC